jgi:hypothetical protein
MTKGYIVADVAIRMDESPEGHGPHRMGEDATAA